MLSMLLAIEYIISLFRGELSRRVIEYYIHQRIKKKTFINKKNYVNKIAVKKKKKHVYDVDVIKFIL